MRTPRVELFLFFALAVIAGSSLTALFSAWHWPLVGDASLMHYVVFLLKSGRAPYSEIIDINLPGSYFLEAAAMRIFGSGPFGLRLYDGALSAMICGCATALSSPGLRARVCAFAGGLLIVLIHLRDGVVQAGQRDYAILSIVLLAYVLLLRGPFAKNGRGLWLFAFLAGCTMTVKPTMFLLILLPVYTSILESKSLRSAVRRSAGAITAFLLPIAAATYWLYVHHAIPAFLVDMKLAWRSHTGLAHKSFGVLLVHSIQPIALLMVLGIGLVLVRRVALDVEQKLLLFGAVAGLVSFMLQGKGFVYQRYPCLGLLVVVIFQIIAADLTAPVLNQSLAAAALALCCLWWAPRFALTVSRYDRIAPFEASLARDLTALHAGPGEVQCLDTVGGCINALYDDQLVQATGYLYDCYAYVGPIDERAFYRQSFLAAVEADRPRYIVLTSQFCLAARANGRRIEDWPALQTYLANGYTRTVAWQPTEAIRWWNEPELQPSFEIFVRQN